MQQIKAALFDFDGVLADTEPLYDQFWDDAGIRYHTGIPHFAAVIKGTTMSNVMKKYFQTGRKKNNGRSRQNRMSSRAACLSHQFRVRWSLSEC